MVDLFFEDNDGNVFQKDNKGKVNQRDNKSNSWKPANNTTANNPVNRDMQARDRSNQRTNNYNTMSRPAAKPAGRPNTGSRPAGGGKRR
ncbi:hypothetical protein [Flavihumibacter fluvii]|uniref:hypothetical protein n=1 Tax=Flavihumibacter fluvii TaxID=2838157 RepID=UPI001BDDE397|nr:hypothetical protein [Flavihumibacter fluvii]ULQ54221.1 hypothetical protein KJS93_07805 [Flavihumibacter fluvii]